MLFDSRNKLNSCEPKIIEIVKELGLSHDFVVCCGHRTKEEQELAFKSGNSKVKFPNSKHNSLPSSAVDLAPCSKDGKKIDWNDIKAFKALAQALKEIAEAKGVTIEWGGSWVSFKDYPHFQIKE